MDVSTGDQLEILARAALALGLGALIGLEREMRGYPAGIRTIALVAFGSCLFTDISLLMGGNDRVAAQVVTGIGFLGAGVIFREGAGVKGVTTAATIWAAAAIGMAVGVELYVVAIASAVGVFALLQARPLTRWVEERVSAGEREIADEVDKARNAVSKDNGPERSDD